MSLLKCEPMRTHVCSVYCKEYPEEQDATNDQAHSAEEHESDLEGNGGVVICLGGCPVSALHVTTSWLLVHLPNEDKKAFEVFDCSWNKLALLDTLREQKRYCNLCAHAVQLHSWLMPNSVFLKQQVTGHPTSLYTSQLPWQGFLSKSQGLYRHTHKMLGMDLLTGKGSFRESVPHTKALWGCECP